MKSIFYLVFKSLQWHDTNDPVAMFWKKEDFDTWIDTIQDIHEAYDVYKVKRNEDGTLEILGRI